MKPHVHKWARYLRTETKHGLELMVCGCGECDATFSFPLQGATALAANRVLDAISAGADVSVSSLQHDCKIKSRGHLVRIFRHLMDEGHVRLVARGRYGPQRPRGDGRTGNDRPPNPMVAA